MFETDPVKIIVICHLYLHLVTPLFTPRKIVMEQQHLKFPSSFGLCSSSGKYYKNCSNIFH